MMRRVLIGCLALFLLAFACAGGVVLGVIAAPRLQGIFAPAPTATPTAVADRPHPTPPPTRSPSRPTPTSAPEASPEPPSESSGDGFSLPEADWEALAEGLRPEARAMLHPEDGRPLIRMALRVEPEARRLRGRMAVTVSRQGPEVCFRAFANAKAMGGSRLEVGGLQVDGRPVTPQWSADRTAFTLRLPERSGPTVEVTLLFTTTLGTREAGYGLMRRHPDGRMVVYYGYPEVARMENGRCVLDPPWENGDLHQAEAAHYWIRLEVPAGTAVAISGVERGEQEIAGRRVLEVVAPFARNVVLVAGPMEERTLEAAPSLRVRGFFSQADEEAFGQGLEAAANALRRFGEAFGGYPFPELDVVEVPLSGGAAGVEASGLVLIGEDVYAMGDLGSLLGGGAELDLPGFVVAHEVAHQWWYGMVGNDAHREPWLDEALTNWSAVFWVEQAHGEAAAEATWDALVLLPYRLRLMEGDLPLDLPTDRYSELDYAGVVYGKGAWMVEVLRREMGEERFFTFLRRYLERHRWGWATGESWRATLAEVWGRSQAEAFYRKWVSGAGVTEEDLPEGGMFGEMLSDPNMKELMRMLLEALMEAQP